MERGRASDRERRRRSDRLTAGDGDRRGAGAAVSPSPPSRCCSSPAGSSARSSPPSPHGSTASVCGDRWHSSPATRSPPWPSCPARCSRSPRGAIFGLGKGTALVLVAATLGASAAFLVSRYVARRFVERRLAGNERFAAIDRAIGTEGRKIVLLLRLSPAVPVQSAQLRARPHPRALRGLSGGVGRHAARHAALRVLRQGGGRRGALAGGAAVPRGPAYYGVLALGLVATRGRDDARDAHRPSRAAGRRPMAPMAPADARTDGAETQPAGDVRVEPFDQYNQELVANVHPAGLGQSRAAGAATTSS